MSVTANFKNFNFRNFKNSDEFQTLTRILIPQNLNFEYFAEVEIVSKKKLLQEFVIHTNKIEKFR